MKKFCVMFYTEVEGGEDWDISDWDIAAWADTIEKATELYNSILAPKAIFECVVGCQNIKGEKYE